MTALELRPYQLDALDRVAKAEARAVRKQLGVAATGLGKTIMFCALARARQPARTLVLAHRDELVSQAAAKVREVWPDVEVGIVKAERDDVHAQVVVASVQTLARGRRLDKLVNSHHGTMGALELAHPPGPFGLVVVDEAHHTAAATYRKILDALDAGSESGPLLLGVTATPDRGDGKGLDDLFDEIVFNYDVLWGIRSGYLCDVAALKVQLDVDFTKVKTSRGDYEAGAVGAAMRHVSACSSILQAWQEHAADRRTLIFLPTVELSSECASLFRSKGIAAAHVSGATPLDERRDILRRYASGELQVVANCMVLTEGFDSPRTDCIVQARPTKSRALFTQIIGRGTRKHPDKGDLLVLDIVGSSDEHSLITVPSLFGLEKRFRQQMGDGSGRLSDVVQQRDDWLVKQGKLTAEDADLFRKMRAEGIAWVQVHVDDELKRYEREMGYRDDATGEYVKLPTIVLTQRREDDESWLCGKIEPDGSKHVLIADVDVETAQGVGEDAVRKLSGNSSQLYDANAAWRKKPPSSKAVAAARKWRLANIEKYKTAGELSDALAALIARKKNRGKRARQG